MSKIQICDFCKKDISNRGITYRIKAVTCDCDYLLPQPNPLELCPECYKRMIEFCRNHDVSFEAKNKSKRVCPKKQTHARVSRDGEDD